MRYGFSRSGWRGIAAMIYWGLFALLCATSLKTPTAHGQTWTGFGSTNNWSTPANWSTNAVPVNNGTAALIFSGVVRLTSTADTTYNINSIAIAQGSGPFSIGGLSLTVGSGGIADNCNSPAIIANPITLSAAQTWNMNNTAGALTMSGPVFTNGNLLTVGGIGAVALSSIIGGSGGLTVNSGTSNVTGLASVTLSGSQANTYSGTTAVNSGVLILNKSVANGVTGGLVVGDGIDQAVVIVSTNSQLSSTGAVTINSGGELDINNSSQVVASLTFNGGSLYGPIEGAVLTAGSLTFGLNTGAVTTNSNTNTASINSPINLNGTTTFTVAPGNTSSGIDLDVASSLSNGSITQNGFGTMRLSGNNTFAGGLTMNHGRLLLGGASPAGTGTLTMGAGTTVQASPIGATLSNAVILGGTVTVTGGQSLTFNGAISGSGGFTINDAAMGSVTFSGSAPNTYSGTTTVNSGGLTLNKTTAGSVPGALVIGDGISQAIVVANTNNQVSNSSPITVYNASEFDVNNSSQVVSSFILNGGAVNGPILSPSLTVGQLIFNPNTGTVTSNASAKTAILNGPLNLNGATTFTVALGNTSSGIDLDVAGISNGSITQNGFGTMRLSGNNTLVGGLTMNHGALLVNGNSAIGTGALSLGSGAILAADGSQLMLSNPVSLLSGAAITNGSLNITLAGPISGGGGLTKDGFNTLTLSGNNTFTGALTITAGTLVQNGALAANVINQSTFNYSSGTFAGRLINQGGANFNGNFTAGNGIENDTSITLSDGQILAANGQGLDNFGTISIVTGASISGTALVNDFSGTLSGSGTISGSLTNLGLLESGSTGINLAITGVLNNAGYIGPLTSFGVASVISAASIINTGDIELAGGRLAGGGALTNSPGGVIHLYSSGVAGGVTVMGYASPLANAGGMVRVDSQTQVTFSGFTGNINGGDIQIQNNATLTLTAATGFPNSGTIEMLGQNSALNGGILTNSGSIMGSGRISNVVLNIGTIEATSGQLTLSAPGAANGVSGQIIVDAGATVLYSQGLATNAGIISLLNATFNNNSAAMTNTGEINGSGTFRTGGAGLANATGGIVDFTAGTNVFGPVTNGGSMSLYGATTTFFANVTNGTTGTIKVTAGKVYFLGNNGMTTSGLYISDPSDNYFNGLSITNTGAVTGGSADRFFLVNNMTMTNAGIFANDGTLSVSAVNNSGTFTQTGVLSEAGNFTNSGTVVIGGSQTWSPGTTFTNAGGSTTLQTDAGSANASPLSLYVMGGTVTFNSPQHLAALSIATNPSQSVALVLTLASTSAFSKAIVAGELMAGGTLTVSLANGFIPVAGQSFDVLDWGTLLGTFSSIQLPALTEGLQWSTSQLYSTGALSVVNAVVPGDFNGNGVVDSGDYVVWRKGVGTTYSQSDYDVWRAHFGQTAGSGSGASANAAVPEPATAVLLIAGLLTFCSRRRTTVSKTH